MSDDTDGVLPLSLSLSTRSRNKMNSQQDGSGDEMDDVSSIASTKEEESSRSQTPTLNGRGRAAWRHRKGLKKSKLQYKCTNFLKEDHRQPLFGINVNMILPESSSPLFATVGHNRITLYECQEGGHIQLVQSYMDPSAEENFYCCTWSYDEASGQPLLAVGGVRGIIRIISPTVGLCVKQFVGHGNAINELKVMPRNSNMLLSVSKDHDLRIWNIKTSVCAAIFGGIDGHRDEVLSADFNLSGTKIVSCGMDHSLKIWNLQTAVIQGALEASDRYNPSKSDSPFPTLTCHFPEFSTRDIHRNYVDCVRWLGDLVLSKSCENCIVCWRPTPQNKEAKQGDSPKVKDKVSVLHRFEVKECDIWYMRFSLDYQKQLMALGNQIGQIFVWDLDTDDPVQNKYIRLSNNKSVSAIRQTAFSKDGNILLAVSDDGTIWRWDRVK